MTTPHINRPPIHPRACGWMNNNNNIGQGTYQYNPGMVFKGLQSKGAAPLVKERGEGVTCTPCLQTEGRRGDLHSLPSDGGEKGRRGEGVTCTPCLQTEGRRGDLHSLPSDGGEKGDIQHAARNHHSGPGWNRATFRSGQEKMLIPV
ncbi:unnamed protein product [Boreogadus saida]